ncbi:hypothetical protein SLS59_002175 [Nothophoma quercina]|uniref:Uncharacterized protein n=1 Tax=Nothophoma quercina TaxID=749835 RepID=A0ABR3RX13_9PLEO
MGTTIMQIVDDKVEHVLLVDYSTTHTFPSGDTALKEAMVADSRAVFKLVDDCCDMWTLRKSATKNAQSEAVLRERTVKVADDYAIVKRCCADYFGRQGQSKASVKGKKLLRLLEMMAIEWNSTQAEQLHNGTLKEVGCVFKSTLDRMNRKYIEAHGSLGLGEHQVWNLSLDHSYLDGLVTGLHQNRWDLTPRDICAKTEELAGIGVAWAGGTCG